MLKYKGLTEFINLYGRESSFSNAMRVGLKFRNATKAINYEYLIIYFLEKSLGGMWSILSPPLM